MHITDYDNLFKDNNHDWMETSSEPPKLHSDLFLENCYGFNGGRCLAVQFHDSWPIRELNNTHDSNRTKNLKTIQNHFQRRAYWLRILLMFFFSSVNRVHAFVYAGLPTAQTQYGQMSVNTQLINDLSWLKHCLDRTKNNQVERFQFD